MMAVLKYKRDGTLDGASDAPETSNVALDVPDGGLVCVEIAPGRWLTVAVSEWGQVIFADKPMTDWRERGGMVDG